VSFEQFFFVLGFRASGSFKRLSAATHPTGFPAGGCLEQSCGSDSEPRSEVENLLQSHVEPETLVKPLDQTTMADPFSHTYRRLFRPQAIG
jgi:hypothetical protein